MFTCLIEPGSAEALVCTCGLLWPRRKKPDVAALVRPVAPVAPVAADDKSFFLCTNLFSAVLNGFKLAPGGGVIGRGYSRVHVHIQSHREPQRATESHRQQITTTTEQRDTHRHTLDDSATYT